MALEVTTNRNDFFGNGVTTDWPTSFKFWDKSEIQCTRVDLQGVEYPLSSNEFEVTGGDGETGVVKVDPPLPGDGTPENSERLIILRVLPLQQLTRLLNQGPYFPKTVETEFDKTNARIQQMSEELARAIRAALSADPNTDFTFPGYEGGKVIGWDPQDPRLVNYSLASTGPYPITTFGARWIALADEVAGLDELEARKRKLFDGVPGPNEDANAGYEVLDVVVDSNSLGQTEWDEYSCEDNTPGGAVWRKRAFGGSSSGSASAYLGEMRLWTGAIPTVAQGWLPLDRSITYDTGANPEYQAIYDYMVALWGADPVTGVGPANAFTTPPIDARYLVVAGAGVPDADPELNIPGRTAGTTFGKTAHKLTAEESGHPDIPGAGGTNQNGSSEGLDTGSNLGTIQGVDAAQAHTNVPPAAVYNGAICWNPALSPLARTLTDLDDTPATLTGSAGKALVVNPQESATQFERRVKTVSLGGSVVSDDVDTLNFSGASVTINNDGNGQVTITISGSGTGGGGVTKGTPFAVGDLAQVSNASGDGEIVSAAIAGAAVKAHVENTAGNPHGTTAGDVGADPAGAAGAVQNDLNNHKGQSNPHGTSASDVGADPEGSANAVQQNLDTHTAAGSTNAHVMSNIFGLVAELAGKLSATAGKLINADVGYVSTVKAVDTDTLPGGVYSPDPLNTTAVNLTGSVNPTIDNASCPTGRAASMRFKVPDGMTVTLSGWVAKTTRSGTSAAILHLDQTGSTYEAFWT